MTTIADIEANPPRILIVDDERHNRQLLEIMLTPEGFALLTASSGEEALAMVAAQPPDLILLDIMMPGMDGYFVANQIKSSEATRDIPVIMVTALNDRASRLQGLEAGAEDFLSKPVDRAELINRVRNMARLKSRGDRRYSALAEQSAFKDEFLSHVSHELRSPLTAIRQFTSILLDGLAGELTHEQRQYQQIVLKNIDQLQAMIDDLLEVTRLDTGRLIVESEPASLVEAVTDAAATMRGCSEDAGVTIEAELAADLPLVLADRIRIRQILIILLDNAIKFSPRGTVVTVRGRRFERDPGFVVVDVIDRGCGISPDVVERIFERLYQVEGDARSSRKGLGLGLYICKALVTQHKGDIWVESLPQAGSTFSFTLPMWSGG